MGRISVRDDVHGAPFGLASYIEAQRARSINTLGEFRSAAEGFGRAIDGLPAVYSRERGVHLARQAPALAGAGEAEEAGRAGLDALGIGVETGSGRITRELANFENDLAKWHNVATVNESGTR